MNCLQNSEEYNHELKYIITLDGGTTNTRAYLWRQDGSFVSSKKLNNKNLYMCLLHFVLLVYTDIF